jgi:ribokinase
MSTDRRAVTVVGSVHMDLIAVADRLPARGESLTGHRFSMFPGGKAGNQAAQVALQGVSAFLVARLGDDVFGEHLRTKLRDKGVDTRFLTTDATVATGASPVFVGNDGEYASIIVPGAAALLDETDIDAARPAIASSRAVMVQLEIPTAATVYAARVARELGAEVVLNASPAPASATALPDALWRLVDLLVVNGLEASRIGARSVPTPDTAVEVAAAIRERLGVPTVVVTLGGQGVAAVTPSDRLKLPAWPVDVVQTVGAGDAFAGTLVAELASGAPFARALSYATAAGALAVTRPGAFDALPTRAEIRDFVAARSGDTAQLGGATRYTIRVEEQS